MSNKGDSPYSTAMVSNDINYSLNPTPQMKQYKREDAATKHTFDTLPYEMGSLPIYFGEMVDNALGASRLLNGLLESDNFKNKKDLARLKNNIDKIIHYLISNVDNTLDKFILGRNEEDN